MDYHEFLKMLLQGVTDSQEAEAIKKALNTLMSGGLETFPGALSVIQARILKIQLELAAKMETPQGEREKLLLYFHELESKWKPSFEGMLEETKEAFLNLRKLRVRRLLYALFISLLLGMGGGGYGTYQYMEAYLLPTQQEKEWLEFRKDLMDNKIAIGRGDKTTDDTYQIQIASARPFVKVKSWEKESHGLSVYTGKTPDETQTPTE